jgi:DNA modification methylase
MSQNSLFDTLIEQVTKPSGPVTCLGLKFVNDQERRKHFSELLRLKLQDQEFRKTEGFPQGKDEDILNLSDPPYYTACPNPWINDFINFWEAEKIIQYPQLTLSETQEYHREPFASDVSEGKNDPIYNGHSYHTKVPHKAIMRYILHYTNPGDIVFDGFCGTGMTGVAAQLCGDRNVIIELGYRVTPDGTILQEEFTEDGKKNWVPFSKLGLRRVVLNDLSPAATFIAYNYNTPIKQEVFEKEAQQLLSKVENEYGWMYETKHFDGRMGKINYTVWSDVFICPECNGEVVFWEVAVDRSIGKVRDDFPCPHCSVTLNKKVMQRSLEAIYDQALNKIVTQARHRPVLFNYSMGTKTFEKKLDVDDYALLDKITAEKSLCWFPTNELPDGFNTRQPINSHGFSHVHHFYEPRSLLWLSNLVQKSQGNPSLLLVSFSILNTITKLYRYVVLKPDYKGQGGGLLSGTLYVPSLIRGLSAHSSYSRSISRISRIFKGTSSFQKKYLISCSSTSQSSLPSNSIDYIFLDPPFGANLNYSELNFIWESWLKVHTNINKEAIENKVQGKGANEYRELMTECFREAHRVLKPGHWMTVEFSNTKASVWNNIQSALAEAGFIVANVSALDKKQGSFKAVTTPTAVKQDLVISAYKPNDGFEARFQKEAQTEEGVWDFTRTHLKYLPVIKRQGHLLQMIPERDPRILFDQILTYFVRKGYQVPISSQEFQAGLAQRFIERDGMYFLQDQVAEYDRKKMASGELQQTSLFVYDEATALQWLRQLLKEKPQTFAEINPQFMQQLGGWSKNEEQLDLRELLNQNFLCYEGKELVPEQIHAYLSTNWKELRNLPKDDNVLIAKASDRWYLPDPNKVGDLEKLRERALLKEFEDYKQVSKKLKVFRLEAVRAGFKKCWQDRDYATIVAVAEKIPNNVLEEDPKLLMWYDQAVTRMGGE